VKKGSERKLRVYINETDSVRVENFAMLSRDQLPWKRVMQIWEEFKDLNKNGKLDPYEDWRLPINDRIENLIISILTAQEFTDSI